MSANFKTCPKCGFVWSTREAFLDDTDLDLIGYQVNFEELALGYFLFNHSCKDTLSLPAGDFMDLYKGHVFKERATGSDQCRDTVCIRTCLTLVRPSANAPLSGRSSRLLKPGPANRQIGS